MKHKESALKKLLQKGSFADIVKLCREDARLVFGLAELLVTAADEKLYMSAAVALGKVGPEGIPFLIHTIGSNTHEKRRIAAIIGLDQQPTETRAVPTLIDALADINPKVRQKAATVLGNIGDPRAVNGLVQLLQDEHHYPRESAVQALRKIGSAKALPHLSRLVTAVNQDQALAHHAQQAIDEIQQASGVQLPR